MTSIRFLIETGTPCGPDGLASRFQNLVELTRALETLFKEEVGCDEKSHKLVVELRVFCMVKFSSDYARETDG